MKKGGGGDGPPLMVCSGDRLLNSWVLCLLFARFELLRDDMSRAWRRVFSIVGRPMGLLFLPIQVTGCGFHVVKGLKKRPVMVRIS
jgi:hypothetical protein